ncbi:MAG: DegV family protein [Clostridia bacterium]|nr:DegV family protein [Clostridia bacterium]
MMKLEEVKIVADSSADTLTLGDFPFAIAPLKMISSQKEYVDDANLDVEQMLDELALNDEKVSSSCPSPEDWVSSFGDAKYVFCFTITSGLSGSYNSARIAKEDYEAKYPDRKVHIVDSLSTGPEIVVLIEKVQELVLAGYTFEEVSNAVDEYQKTTGLVFMLRSLRNLKNNGRVNPIVAKVAGVLGIKIIGEASEKGDLKPLHKHKSERTLFAKLLDCMKEKGYHGGKVRIGHCRNEKDSFLLKEHIFKEFPSADVLVYKLRGLCSFYAEIGGVLVGFES